MALVSIAVMSARVPLGAEGVSGHTLLWILPDADDPQHFEIGVANKEFEPTDYRLVVTAGDDLVHSRAISLAPNRGWRGSIPVPLGAERIEARLFREGASDAYRRVHLVVHDETASASASASRLGGCLQLELAREALIDRVGEAVARLIPGTQVLFSDPASCGG